MEGAFNHKMSQVYAQGFAKARFWAFLCLRAQGSSRHGNGKRPAPHL